MGSSRCPGRVRPWSECLRGRPDVLGASGPCPRARAVDQLSRKTRDLVGGPALSTSCPRRLRPVREGLRCPQLFRATRTVPEGPGVEPLSRATRDLVRGPRGSTNCPGRLRPLPEVPQCRPTLPGDSSSSPRSHGRPAVLGDSCPGLRARGVDLDSWVTRAHAKGPAGSTSCPW